MEMTKSRKFNSVVSYARKRCSQKLWLDTVNQGQVASCKWKTIDTVVKEEKSRENIMHQGQQDKGFHNSINVGKIGYNKGSEVHDHD